MGPLPYYPIHVGGAAIAILMCGVVSLLMRRRWRNRGGLLWVANAGLGSSLVLGFLLLCEVLFGIFYDQTDSNLTSNVSKRWEARYVRRNNMRLRDDQTFEPHRSNGVFRIVLLGDSFTFGHGISQPQDRFSDQIRARLEQAAPQKFQLYNFGVPGTDTVDHVAMLRMFPRYPFEFDLVLLAYTMNDAAPLSAEYESAVSVLQSYKPMFWLSRHTYLFNFLHYRAAVLLSGPQATRYFEWLPRMYEDPTWGDHRMELSAMVNICRQRERPLRVVTFPLVSQIGSTYNLAEAHRKLSIFWTEAKIAHLDLLPVFENYAASDLVVNRYDTHPNERAHAMAADAIYKYHIEPLVDTVGKICCRLGCSSRCVEGAVVCAKHMAE